MAIEARPQFLSEVVASLLPYLRRYARALTGDRARATVMQGSDA